MNLLLHTYINLQHRILFLFFTLFILLTTDLGAQELITGQVLDNKHQPVQAASVSIHGKGIVALTDSLGYFSIKTSSAGLFVTLSAMGMRDTTIQIERNGIPFKITMERLYKQIEEVVITSTFFYRRSCYNKATCGGFQCSIKGMSIRQTNDVSVNNVLVYPNPAPTSSLINIKISDTISNNVIVQVLNMSGALLQQEQISRKDPVNQFLLKLNFHTPGMYVLRVVDMKRNQSSTAKFVLGNF